MGVKGFTGLLVHVTNKVPEEPFPGRGRVGSNGPCQAGFAVLTLIEGTNYPIPTR